MYADGDFEPALLDLIDRARERLVFSIYFFDLDTVIAALVRAHRRGVHVRGLVHTHRSFGLDYVRRTEGAVRALSAAGITDLHFGPANQFTHAKLIVRDDDELMIGTGNWLLEDVEIHPQLHARFVNPALAAEIAAHVSRTIEARGTRIAP
jgi:phosphatidylserine/phosphatidylglycerophosphate/cardiolipin synthase-like enzyme